MSYAQSTFEQFQPNSDGWPPVSRDTWGPTMREPIPEAERGRLPNAPEVPVDARELVGTDLAPSDFEIVAGVCSPATARRRGYHPDDAEPSPRQVAQEAEIHAAAMKRVRGFSATRGSPVEAVP